MKIDKIRIEKIKTWKQTLKKKIKKKHTHTHTHKNYEKGMETRKGKYSKRILKEKKLQKRRNQIKSRK
jgi:hypothetical protein